MYAGVAAHYEQTGDGGGTQGKQPSHHINISRQLPYNRLPTFGILSASFYNSTLCELLENGAQEKMKGKGEKFDQTIEDLLKLFRFCSKLL